MKADVRREIALSPDGRAALSAGRTPLLDGVVPKGVKGAPALEILGAVARFAGGEGNVRVDTLRRRLGPDFSAAVLARLLRRGLLREREVAIAPGPGRRTEEFAVLAEPRVGGPGSPPDTPPRGQRQREILRVLTVSGGRAAVKDLLRTAAAGRAALRALERLGRVRVEAVERPRRPFALDIPAEPPVPLILTPTQQEVFDSIGAMIDEGRFRTALLHGVTGSGKTEIYLRSIERTVRLGRKALYLVPEIGLTPLLARRMRARFGEVLALLHSGLSDGERHDEWRRIRDGKVDVVLGARSAVFAPLKDLGLIIVDEEHDSSFKQDEYPRYNGRDLAVLRAKMQEAVAVLGSATPSMESYRRATQGGYALLRLPERIGGAGLPVVERVDMRREFEEVGRESSLSRRLLQAIEDRLRRKEQSLVLLNRRGFSTFVLCRACGEQVECRRCSIAMTLHMRDQRLRCHYCGDARKVPQSCPACKSSHLYFGGTGTERLETVLHAHFPAARIERMDRDTVRGRGAAERLLTRVESGEVDILLGTQMIAKGHDFPNVTLVGVLTADALLGLPDFRAGERTFQLLSQVAGRSGRRETGGEVVVQAYYADHHAIKAACDHDFAAFAAEEMTYRRVMNYPPYTSLALVLVKDRIFDRASAGAALAAGILREAGKGSLQVLGPAPAPLERLRGEYRVQVLVKSASRPEIQAALSRMLAEIDRRNERLPGLVIDVDPMSTL